MKLLTVKEASEELRMSVYQIYRYAAKRLIGVRLGGKIMIPMSQIETIIAEGLPKLNLVPASPTKKRRARRSTGECLWLKK
jgi:hypothetical protein